MPFKRNNQSISSATTGDYKLSVYCDTTISLINQISTIYDIYGADNRIYINFGEVLIKPVELYVYDIQGRLVIKTFIPEGTVSFIQPVNASGSVYLVRLTDAHHSYAKPVHLD